MKLSLQVYEILTVLGMVVGFILTFGIPTLVIPHFSPDIIFFTIVSGAILTSISAILFFGVELPRS